MAEVLELTSDNWDNEVVYGDRPVLVDFWGPGCAPCTQMLPIVDKIAAKYAGRIKVGKVNIAENEDLAAEFGVDSVPRFYLFHRARKPLDRIMRATTAARLEEMLERVLEGK